MLFLGLIVIVFLFSLFKNTKEYMTSPMSRKTRDRNDRIMWNDNDRMMTEMRHNMDDSKDRMMKDMMMKDMRNNINVNDRMMRNRMHS